MPTLPLAERSTTNSFVQILPLGKSAAVRARRAPAIPALPLEAGEHYRFHFDMSKCIGCHCCEVACNEQNNLPANLPWRRVGEVEGGEYPFTQRFHLSMGCNHCLEPACMIGCPVEAYTKSEITGIVLHDPEMCIGCQYCTWNCPYGVPQFNPERGVVGKCDMCHGRLEEGLAPACVNACPEDAIQIEAVNSSTWRSEYAAVANAPGLPTAEHTLSTTRVTLPQNLHIALDRVDSNRIRPEHAHTPLVIMTVLIQLSVGALTAMQWATLLHRLEITIAVVLVGQIALGFSLLHLGRPAFAWRALKMWKQSWLSREVLLLSLYAGASGALLPLLLVPSSLTRATTMAALVFGWAGLWASANIYLVSARPAWNMPATIADFLLTACLLGPVVVLMADPKNSLLHTVAMGAAIAQLANQLWKLLAMRHSLVFEMKASARLLTGRLQRPFAWRMFLGLAGILFLAMNLFTAALALLLAAELLGRYLFFVSVVPKNIASTFIGMKKVA